MSKLFTLKIQYGKDFVDIDFPCKDGVLDEKLKSIGAEKETVHFIKDVQHWDKAMRLLQHRFENLDEVNYLAKRLDSFADEEFRAFYAVISLNTSLTVADLINQTFNMSRITLIRDVSNLEAVGRNHYMTMHLGAPIEEDMSNRKGEHSGVFIEEEPRAVLTPTKKEARQNGRRFKEPNEPMFTLTVCDRHGIIRYGKVRRLMPIECWRLQGFTDEQFYKAVATGLKDSHLYKMAGNAVSVPVISALGQMIKEIDEGTH